MKSSPYSSLKKYFFEEIKNDKLLKLPENFYDEVREYIITAEDKEKKRIEYYFKEIRKLRIYKALYLDEERENLLLEELNIITAIENISTELKSEESPKPNEIETPKLIYTINDIDVVKVDKNFPSFTDGSYIYSLNKNDVLSLDRRIASILEKHRIISRIGESYENAEKS
ncbi:conserved hypothetical protein [Methanocaldococcus vulcanius M7]|uniref:DNA replication complex GINS family protein n=1 Tax=Methanocaldococcus vulcanius (strain ATCC 700851 / DSM 12094 / M7) TaxID=579137 RepID=C9RDP0_METVM|nr:hypothetical protein [Methanocaldococcus vulcanius]ACX73419.1 conserved hypothetical protein [Methanocaldococcus vulcanius M7]